MGEPGEKTPPAGAAPGAAEKPAEPAAAPRFVESSGEPDLPPEVLGQRICDFGLRIEGSPLEAVLERFKKELEARGPAKLKPVFYLSDEWGVPESTVAIGIPFYLADERLRKVQRVKGGRVEGLNREDILRYLRHELGHVVNYAFRLHEGEEWTRVFGAMSRPYLDEYRSVPFHPDFVRHLPGQYAQKHPDDDWAETFAVWMTPRLDWRAMYADAPGALRKLELCDRLMAELRDREPPVTAVELLGQAAELQMTVQEFYQDAPPDGLPLPRSLDGELRSVFSSGAEAAGGPEAVRLGSGATLLRRQRASLVDAVYHYTGCDPALLEPLLDHLAARAKELELGYPLAARDEVLVHTATLLTTLAMNYLYRGSFFAR
ncbi:MAG TPA: putative zinc-binding metallopeptidase [Myxococcota bacterium]|nr:putative zinc-binding metallopeptidase [Myxococcota bacterium]HRY93767.1 putative zinc-binding metallopeptidase [Myxococcota bacterium]